MVELKTDMKTSATKKVKKSKPDVPEVGMEIDENPKVVKELKLDFETDYNLNQAKITDFVEALLKIHNGKQSQVDSFTFIFFRLLKCELLQIFLKWIESITLDID